MGICHSSYEKTKEATAKLVLEDGTLQEFHYPVMVSYLTLKNPTCFICNSDEMESDGVVSEVSDKEELQLGQLYFVLPLSRLNRRLQPEEMAMLTVRASFALAKIWRRFRMRSYAKAIEESGDGWWCWERSKFMVKLSTIAE